MTEAQKEIPKFRTGAQTFASGLALHPPESEIEWVVPEDWNEEKYGKHFASHGPSVTFTPLNKAAEDLMAAHKAKVAELRKPKPTADDERTAKLEKMVLDMLNVQGEAQAEARRAQARHEELMERLIAAQEKKK